jgi:hypothetical protein
VQPLHHHDDGGLFLIVQAVDGAFPEPPGRIVALGLGLGQIDGMRIVDHQPIATLRGQRAEGHALPGASVAVGEGHFRRSRQVHLGPERLVPLRQDQIAGLARVPLHRDIVERSGEVAQRALALWAPLPRLPQHRHQQRFHAAWRDVDQKPVDPTVGHRLQMLADRVDVPVVAIARVRLEDVPRLFDEAGEGLAPRADGVGVTPDVLALDRLGPSLNLRFDLGQRWQRQPARGCRGAGRGLHPTPCLDHRSQLLRNARPPGPALSTAPWS